MNSYEKDFYSWTQEKVELLENGRFSEVEFFLIKQFYNL